jgi:hypothetical protein
MQESIKEELTLIKEVIASIVSTNAIYLFGSYAYGEPIKKVIWIFMLLHPMSNLILLIFVQKNTLDSLQKRKSISRKYCRKERNKNL